MDSPHTARREPLGLLRTIARPVATHAAGDVFGGRYKVYGKAEGGLGAVYFVVDTESNTPLAMKTPLPKPGIPEGKLRSLYRRFEGEVEVWASLGNHPNVVRCHYLTLVDDVPYVALEWVAERGRANASLSAFVHYNGTLPVQQALDFALDVCRGLLHAQQAQPGFVHRDLKPDNVLVTQQRIAKVTDFGFAQFEPVAPRPGGRYRSESIVGTPRYMAPEQWERGIVDERADVYAMGSILYEMLTAKHLFDLKKRPEWREAHRHTPPPHLPADLPPALDALVQRCLAKRPDERYATVRELQAALGELYCSQFGAEPRAVPGADDLTAEDFNNLGNTHCYLGGFEAALDEYGRALAVRPEFAAAFYGKGIAFHGLEEHGQAIEQYDAALAVEPANAAALYNRGNSHAALRDWPNAISDFTAALGLDPKLASALYNRGLAHLEEGQPELALADFDGAIDAGGLAIASRSRASLHLEAGRTADAIADLGAAIAGEDDPELVLADRALRADLLRRNGEPRRAALDYNAIIDAGAGSAQVYYDRGLCLAAMHRHAAAVADMTRAVRKLSEPARAYRARAEALRALGDHDRALEDYARILDLDPADANAYYEMGLVLGMRGQFQEALAFLREAARLGHGEAEGALRRFGYAHHEPVSTTLKPEEARR